jgi:hypothetical protein
MHATAHDLAQGLEVALQVAGAARVGYQAICNGGTPRGLSNAGRNFGGNRLSWPG